MIYLAEITAYDPAISGERVLRYSTDGFVTAPTETPPDTFYEPRIQQPALMRRDAFSGNTTGGESRVGYGEMVLVNNDGGLDGLMDYGFDGRRVTLHLGEPGAAYPSGFTTVLTGTMEQATFEWDKVSIRLRDRQAELDKPVQTALYAGSNSLPNGLEGMADDLKGTPKPRVYGQVLNVSPPCVNTARQIYQVNDGAVASVDAVYDRGMALATGADYTSQSDMETNAPAAGAYRAWPAGGYFRLGASPAGQITADVTQGATAADRTAAQIAKAIVTGPGGVAAGDVSAADIAVLDAANSAVIGIWLPDGGNIRAALDQICQSVGAWWGFDRAGKYRIRRLELPSGTPVATLTSDEIIKIERTVSGDSGRGVPAWRVTVGHAQNHTVQGSDIAGAVTDARRAWLREGRRTATAEDAAVKTTHLLAPEIDFDSLFVAEPAAQGEANRRLTLHKTRRDTYIVRARLDADLATSIDLGAVVELMLSRFGLGAGKLFAVIGLQTDLRVNAIDLTLWG